MSNSGTSAGAPRVRGFSWSLALVTLAGVCGLVDTTLAAVPPVPVPPENPITEPKRVLGKMLFWDEQLSSDNTMSCGTCHSPARAGSDGRRVRHPGSDGVFLTADDVFGSPGVISQNASDEYLPSNAFALQPQVTGRSANSMINAMFAPQLFWDGRASSTFRDPVTNQVLIASGGALESQIVGPPVNNVEMAHAGRDWAQITAKLQAARPMALATALPADIAAKVAPETTYAQLFTEAFGDSTVTAARIAFAIATYERTLVSDRTPFDLGTMTPQQNQGFNAFQASNCNACHVVNNPGGALFTGNGFRNIGLRPPAEDTGLQQVTNNPADRGKFKVPGLRNVGLKNSFMHNGQFTNLTDLIRFYARAPGAAPQFPDNRDPLMQNVNVPPQAATVIQDFLQNGLTDPRVRDQTFPFDRPTLWADRPGNRVQVLGGGTAGSSGQIPQMLAATPPMVGNAYFKFGVSNGLGSANARLVMSFVPPIAGRVREDKVLGTVTLAGAGSGAGFGTVLWSIPTNGSLSGRTAFFQWIVTDASGVGGVAVSQPAQATFFCAGAGCPPICVADIDDGSGIGLPDDGVGIEDLTLYLARFETGGLNADVDNGSGTGATDGGVGIEDLLYYLQRFEQGC